MRICKITLVLMVISLCVYLLEELTRDRTTRRLIHYLETELTDGCDNCIIDLRKALKVDYDSLYVFCEYTQDEEISSILGRQYNSPFLSGIPDSHHRIILIKNNKLVYQNVYSSQEFEFDRITQKIVDNNTGGYLIHYSPYYYVKRIPRNGDLLHPNSYRLAVSASRDSLYVYRWDRQYGEKNVFRIVGSDEKYPW